ncbi:hypothetical protein [Thauera sp. SDU_THAU2]|uniref:hypothetical protein n=1 Tax=Thauera sp. SDU_THAU2 TaxID=3136633 RepID=UPI00311F49FA
MVDYRFIFLQHGVILHDLSQWLNTKPIFLFVTSTEAEYESIAGYDSNYIFSEKEVLLSGLPRHDRLLARRRAAQDHDHADMAPLPDRRKRSRRHGARQDRELRGDGLCAPLGALLRSERLRRIAEEAGLGILFCPHPNMSMYIDDFDVPGHVEVRHPLAAQSPRPLHGSRHDDHRLSVRRVRNGLSRTPRPVLPS